MQSGEAESCAYMPSRNRVIEANCGTLPLDEEFAMLNSLAHIVLRFFYTRIGDL